MNIQRTSNGYKLRGIEASGLTPRESHAILLLANGLGFNEIAQHMSTSASSAKGRIKNIAFKLRLQNSKASQVIAAAFAAGNLRTALALFAAIHMGMAAPALIDNETDLNRVARVRTYRPTRKEHC